MTAEMKELNISLKISYRWWRSDGAEINPQHEEFLVESAMDRIMYCMAKGYHAGELHDNIHANDDDPEDGIEYIGWWEIEEPTRDTTPAARRVKEHRS